MPPSILHSKNVSQLLLDVNLCDAVIVVGLSTFFITFFIFFALHSPHELEREEGFRQLPTISLTGCYSPASFIFTGGVHLLSVLLFFLFNKIYLIYDVKIRNLYSVAKQMSEEMFENSLYWNQILWYMGMFSVVLLGVTGSVPKKETSKRGSSSKSRISISNTIDTIQKLVHAPPDKDTKPIPSHKEAKKSIHIPDESIKPQVQAEDKAISSSFTSTPLFEHFLVIGVPVESATGMADLINRKNETLSDRLKNQMGSFWKKSSSSSSITGNSKANVDVFPPAEAPPTPKKSTSLAGKWGELSKTLKTAGNQGNKGGIFDLNILPMSGGSNKAESNNNRKSSNPAKDSQSSNEPVLENQAPVSVPVASSRNSNVSYTEPSILYRYPPDADPPPPEVCDFCLPSGGRLRHLVNPADKEQSTLEMLYGQGQSQRSPHCFIFILEDKTLDTSKNVSNEESGEHTGRLYGVCVINPRLLNPYSRMNGYAGTGNTSPPGVDFEAAVCYCFVTRFPLFDFFFQIMWNIIAFERISRMIDVTEHSADSSEVDIYRYIPKNVYEFVMSRLSNINPPRFGERISLDIDSSLPPVVTLRSKPEGVFPEYFQSSAEWALPPLLHWLDAKTIVWALSLLLSEVKLIILGKDTATVSCAVIGLTALLKPFQWVSPMIPILPIKHLDFIESPVPIIAGIVVDNDSPNAIAFHGSAVTPLNILRQCDDGDVTTVLDLSNKDIFTLSGYKKNIADFLVPGAVSLIEKIDNIISSSNVDKMECNVTTHPPYKVTKVHLDNFNQIQTCVYEHMKTVGTTAKEKAKEVLDGQVKVAEEKVKAQLEHLSSLKDRNKRRASSTSTLFGTIAEDKEDDDESESDNEENDSFPIERSISASSDAPSVGSGYTIPILSLTNMKLPTIRSRHLSKFYERFLSTQTYSEYDNEFEKLLHSVEAAVIGDQTDVEDAVSSSRKRLSGKRPSTRKSMLLGGAVISHKPKHARNRSLYIKPSEEFQEDLQQEHNAESELRLAEEVARNSLTADEKSSIKSNSTVMASQKAYRRTSRAHSEGTKLI